MNYFKKQKRQTNTSQQKLLTKMFVAFKRDSASEALDTIIQQTSEIRFGFEPSASYIKTGKCGCVGHYNSMKNSMVYTTMCNSHFSKTEVASKLNKIEYADNYSTQRSINLSMVKSNHTVKYGVTNNGAKIASQTVLIKKSK